MNKIYLLICLAIFIAASAATLIQMSNKEYLSKIDLEDFQTAQLACNQRGGLVSIKGTVKELTIKCQDNSMTWKSRRPQ